MGVRKEFSERLHAGPCGR